MSWVASVMVSFEIGDEAACREFSRWLETEAPRRDPEQWVSARGNPPTGVGFLREQTGQDTTWGGWKYPECNAWAGALNHADIDVVVEKFAALPWKTPAAAQL